MSIKKVLIYLLAVLLYTPLASAEVVLTANTINAYAGDTITLIAQYPEGFTPERVNIYSDTLLKGGKVNEYYNSGPFDSFEITLPPEPIGNVTLTLVALNNTNNTDDAGTLSIMVLPKAAVESLLLTENYVVLSPPGETEMNNSADVVVEADYDDGIRRVVDDPSIGVQYASSNPHVVSVSDEGVINALIPGTAVVMVSLDGAMEYVGVKVINAARLDAPPELITDKLQILAGGFRYDRSKRVYLQEITVTNISSLPIVNSIRLLFDSLAPGVSVKGPYAGKTRYIEPFGTTYVSVTTPSGMLYPGQTGKVVVEFENISGAQITYALYPYAVAYP